MPSLSFGAYAVTVTKARGAYRETRRGSLGRSPKEKGEEQMQAYYWKVFRHLLSTTVLTGFGSLN
jgi:hypothetical protein